jgi:hypothetical protein
MFTYPITTFWVNIEKAISILRYIGVKINENLNLLTNIIPVCMYAPDLHYQYL